MFWINAILYFYWAARTAFRPSSSAAASSTTTSAAAAVASASLKCVVDRRPRRVDGLYLVHK